MVSVSQLICSDVSRERYFFFLNCACCFLSNHAPIEGASAIGMSLKNNSGAWTSGRFTIKPSIWNSNLWRDAWVYFALFFKVFTGFLEGCHMWSCFFNWTSLIKSGSERAGEGDSEQEARSNWHVWVIWELAAQYASWILKEILSFGLPSISTGLFWKALS